MPGGFCFAAGPMIYKGLYHLFYQYNPEDAVNNKGKIVWAHSTSTDLVNWIPHDNAISVENVSQIRSSMATQS